MWRLWVEQGGLPGEVRGRGGFRAGSLSPLFLSEWGGSFVFFRVLVFWFFGEGGFRVLAAGVPGPALCVLASLAWVRLGFGLACRFGRRVNRRAVADRQTAPLSSLLRWRCLCRPLGYIPTLGVLAASTDCVDGMWAGVCVHPGRWGACAGPLFVGSLSLGATGVGCLLGRAASVSWQLGCLGRPFGCWRSWLGCGLAAAWPAASDRG